MKRIAKLFKDNPNGVREYKSAPEDVEFNGVVDRTILFSNNLLDEFRETVGRLPAETGGMLACSKDINRIDTWLFDRSSVNTVASYTYDVSVMEPQHKNWRANGIRSMGFIHSHPSSYRRPSYDDIATGYALMKYFGNSVFYLPIVISERNGCYLLYFFVLRKTEDNINVNLDYVLKANTDGYVYRSFRRWNMNYNTVELEEFFDRANGTVGEENIPNGIRVTDSVIKNESENDKYFSRIKGVYPENVLDKVVICIGLGGARSYCENMARHGFRNFIFFDGDKVSPSNVATQGVFISEMGKWKAEAIKDRILDINPEASVVCVNRYLDNCLSDEEFETYLDMFPHRKSTDYLILGCCDTFVGNERASNISLKYGIPYIGAAVYKYGLCAEVIFVYPGLTASCPRCMIESRYKAYENGYKNDVTSEGCSTFSTERLNSFLGSLSIMMLMYNEAPNSPLNKLLEDVKDRNFIWIRMSPYLAASELGISFFDKVFSSGEVSKYTFTDETLWIPQHPNSGKNGGIECPLCNGVGDMRKLMDKWKDTRLISVVNNADG